VRRGCSLAKGTVPCQKYDGNSTADEEGAGLLAGNLNGGTLRIGGLPGAG